MIFPYQHFLGLKFLTALHKKIPLFSYVVHYLLVNTTARKSGRIIPNVVLLFSLEIIYIWLHNFCNIFLAIDIVRWIQSEKMKGLLYWLEFAAANLMSQPNALKSDIPESTLPLGIRLLSHNASIQQLLQQLLYIYSYIVKTAAYYTELHCKKSRI